MTHGELWQRMEWLGLKVKAAMPAESAVALAFAALDVQADDWEPSRELLVAAHKAFLALPGETRRRVFNGWEYSPTWPTPETLLAWVKQYGDRVFAYRKLTTIGNRAFGSRVFEADQVFPDPVRVLVVEGTSQADAIRCLEAALRMVRTQWSEVVGPADHIEQKSGSPEASTPPSLGRGTGGLKLAPTAA